jgi:hypothetical protein
VSHNASLFWAMIGFVLIGWSLASRRNFASSALCFHMCVVQNGNGEFCETGKSANGAWLFKGIVNSRRLTLSLEIRQRNHGSKNRCYRSVCNPSFFMEFACKTDVNIQTSASRDKSRIRFRHFPCCELACQSDFIEHTEKCLCTLECI